MGVNVGKAPINTRRLMRMPISFEVMLGILQNEITIDDLGIPDDVAVIDVQDDWARRCFVILLESPNFPPTEEGKMIPELPPHTLRSLAE